MNVVSIILARGGSKGIPNKNIIDFCGKPLLAWSIEHCRQAGINDIFVSSDSEEILNVSLSYGAYPILRPDDLSGDTASSESGWLHALEIVEKKYSVDWVFAPQVTSPLRHKNDIIQALEIVSTGQYDSLLSVVEIEDFFLWSSNENGLYSINYDYKNRKRRQDIERQYLENGSFYLFKPEILKNYNNRLGKSISIVVMEKYKMFQIDSIDDLKLAEIIMKGYGLDK